MLSSTPSIIRQVCSLLAFTLLHFAASAQTALTWQSAHAVGGDARFPSKMAVDGTGNVYEVGSFNSTITLAGTMLTSQGITDGYLAKYTVTGALAWVRQLGSLGREEVNDVAVDAAGNVYITGEFTGGIALGNNLLLDAGNASWRKAFVIRYSPLGTPEWVQQSSSSATVHAEGSSIGTDANGNVYVTGTLSRTITIGSTTVTLTGPNSLSEIGAYIARFSSSTGALQSLLPAYSYFTSSNILSYSAPTLVVASTGEVFLLNTFYESVVLNNTTLTTRGRSDAMVAKYSAQGIFEWAQQLGGPSSDRAAKGAVDMAGNLYVTGEFTGPATFGTVTLTGYGDSDGYIAKYSSMGTLEWVQPSGGPGSDRLSDVQVDAVGNPYVTGAFSNTAQVGSLTLTSAGTTDIVVATYTPQGQLRWGQSAGGSGIDAGFNLELDALGNVYIQGSFASTCSFGPFTLNTTANSENFTARLSNTPLATRTKRAIPISIYPNPATTIVHLSSVLIGSQVQLLDAVGRIARTTVVTSDATVSVQDLSAGLYTLRATDAQGHQYTGRLAVE